MAVDADYSPPPDESLHLDSGEEDDHAGPSIRKGKAKVNGKSKDVGGSFS